MKALGDELDLQFLVGRQLNQVGVGRWDVSFCFDCDRIVQAMGRVDISSGANTVTIFDGEWRDIAPLSSVVGLDVVSWSRDSDYSFSVTLSEGQRISFFSSDRPYEEIIVRPEMWIY